MILKKISIFLMAVFIVAGVEGCKAKSCDTASNVNERRKKMKVSNSLFSKKERRRMKH